MSEGLPGRFHGDFHFENIIYNAKEKNFVFIDWRQDFCDDLKVGDIYYDLAKLLHGLIVNHEVIRKNQFEINWVNNKVEFNLYKKDIQIVCQEYFYKWCLDNNYDRRKIEIITSLIFLNIAALHHYPYSLLLYS